MKRVMFVCLALALVLSLSVSAFADNGGFVSSPTSTPAPEVESGTVAGGAAVELVVTPVSGTDTLPEEQKTEMNKAYEEILENKDVTQLNTDLAAKVEDLGVKKEDVAVSDLFDLDVKNAAPTTGKVTVKLKVNIQNFVALLHMIDGVWTMVENAAYADGVLSFEVDSFSPFAIVVDTKASTTTPPTGDNSALWMFAALAVVSGAAVVVCWTKFRKQAA